MVNVSIAGRLSTALTRRSEVIGNADPRIHVHLSIDDIDLFIYRRRRIPNFQVRSALASESLGWLIAVPIEVK
jgi:hypothetical protein